MPRIVPVLVVIAGFALMLAGPLLQGLGGNTDPNAYIFAPVMLAGLIPLIAGRDIRPSPARMVPAILICGAVAMALWYLGGLLGPYAIAGYVPLACAVAGAVLTAGTNLLRGPPA